MEKSNLNHSDRPRTGVRSTEVGMFVTTQEYSPLYRLWSGKEDASEATMHQTAAGGAEGLPNRIMLK